MPPSANKSKTLTHTEREVLYFLTRMKKNVPVDIISRCLRTTPVVVEEALKNLEEMGLAQYNSGEGTPAIQDPLSWDDAKNAVLKKNSHTGSIFKVFYNGIPGGIYYSHHITANKLRHIKFFSNKSQIFQVGIDNEIVFDEPVKVTMTLIPPKYTIKIKRFFGFRSVKHPVIMVDTARMVFDTDHIDLPINLAVDVPPDGEEYQIHCVIDMLLFHGET